jgi:hypothetical protein
MSHKPEEERNGGAEEKASDDREVEGGVFAAMNDIAGETAEAEGQFTAKVKKSAYNGEEAAENKESAPEFAKGVHRRILPQEANRSFLRRILLFIK